MYKIILIYLQQLEARQRNALLTFLLFMADSKYTTENGSSSNPSVPPSFSRTRYSNPNASLPPNNTIQTLRGHTFHKAQNSTPFVGNGGVIIFNGV